MIFSYPGRTIFKTVLLLIFLWGSLDDDGMAQGTVSRERYVQAGLAVLPGGGMQIGYVEPYSFYTLEGIVYARGVLPRKERQGTLLVSGGVGVSLRPLGILRTIGNAPYPYDLDVGMRLGPSLRFATDPTRADKNQQFRLFFEPFLRYSRLFRGRHPYYIELGTHAPVIRAGVWLRF